ncbi:MAG TPA: POTRA domain-containing protein [Saprospiraceae bacterium]|nr:POTRA domain-containing protein [Saprospiraceae bacterium]
MEFTRLPSIQKITFGKIILSILVNLSGIWSHLIGKSLLALSFTVIICFPVSSQQDTLPLNIDDIPVLQYTEKKIYEIAEVNIIGAEGRDRNAIRSIAGLRIGDKITIPGEKISTGLKALWKLRLFEDVKIIQEKTEGDLVWLTIYLKDRPTLSRFTLEGIKQSHQTNLIETLKGVLNVGSIVTDEQKNIASKKIKEYFVEKGRLNVKVDIEEVVDEGRDNSIRLIFQVDTGDKIKIKEISIEGNSFASDKKIRSQLKKTKKKGTFLKSSKYVPAEYENDKKKIIAYYNKEGYRDAIIVKDSLWRNEDDLLMIKIWIEEGQRYYFRNIYWKGNTKYTDEQLTLVLGIQKGDVFNPEILEKRLSFSMDGRDVSSLYMDFGHLAFNVDPVVVSVVKDSIDIEMRVTEGPEFTIGAIHIEGNTKTNEHVVRREIRTRPGQKFRRSDIIRTQREIINLGFFNQENIEIDPIVNPDRGTVDVLYKVEERPADQLELSAGYGGFSGLIGTLGVVFNNFSVRNIRDRSTWSPLPQGDGQKLSLRAQANSRFFRSFNASFTEPWLGGKKPNSFTIGAVTSTFDNRILDAGLLSIRRAFVGLGTQVKWPDDFFAVNFTLNLENIILSDYVQRGLQGNFAVEENGRIVNINNGNFKNFSLRGTVTRSSISDPLYPRSGSRVSLTLQATPLYNVFRRDNFWILGDEDRAQIEQRLREEAGPRNPPTQQEIDAEIASEENARKFEWLEYHKWRFNAEWYFSLAGNLVMAASAKIGVLGAYDNSIGISPFERFEVGGDGLSNQNIGILGRDIIALRGYDVNDLPQNARGGGAVFNKFTLELRYPLSLNPNSTIFGALFYQGGNSWGSFSQMNPFDLRRSFGFGMRVFLPMFGLLGFDYGFGIDKTITDDRGYGKFNIILGFEPD